LSSAFLSKHPLLLLLSIAPGLLAAAVLAISFYPPVYRRIAKWRLPVLILVYIVTRPVLFYVIYVLLGDRQIAGDIRFFQGQGLAALAGKLPYRDFDCYYSPLFPYLMAIPYGIWSHISSGVLAFIVFDIACLILLCKLTRMTLGPDRVMDIAWLHAVNPMVWMITVRYGQDESIICCFLLLAVYLYLKDSRWWAPITLALGVILTKFTTAMGMMAIFTYSKAKARDALVAGGIVVAIYSFFYFSGGDILQPVRGQAASIDGVSLTTMADRLLVPHGYHVMAQRVGSILTLVAVAFVLYLAHRRRLHIVDGLTVSLLAFFLLSPVSYKFYRLWYLGPLGMYALRSNRINRFVFYTALLVVFDDFSFRPATPSALLYLMGVLAAAIVCFEARYIVEILRGGPLAHAKKTNAPVRDKVRAGT